MDKGIEALIADLKFYGGESGCHPDPHYWIEFERLATASNVLALIAALEKAQQRTAELEDEFAFATQQSDDYFAQLQEKDKRITELEAAPNGMMQLSNQLAEMKPVVLPSAWVEPGNRWLQERDVILAIHAAGGAVEGSE